MTVVTLDSTDIPGILADAGVTLDKPAETPKDDPKPADAPKEKVADPEEEDPDEEEDENGLTAEQKRILTLNMQKAIGKKNAKLRDAEEFAAAQYNERKLAEQRAEALERELAEFRSKSAPPETAKAPEKPDRANFATESEYVDAMIQYGVDQRLREKAEEDAKAAADRAFEDMKKAAEARIARGRELVPDFDDVVSSIDAPVPPAVAGYMQKSEMFAELGYHLAKNPDVLVSLAKLAPDEQLVKIGRIESKLTPFGSKETQNDSKSSEAPSNGQAKPAPSADTDTSLSKPRGKAAPVITPLDGTGSAGILRDSKDMNIREAIEDYSKRNKVNLGMRKRH